MKEKKPRLIGIFGAGRNGSTLLLRLLDGIPRTFVNPLEIKLLSALDDLARSGKVKRTTSSNATTKKLSNLGKKIPAELLIDYYFPYQVEVMKRDFLSQIGDIRLNKRALLEEIKKEKFYTAGEFSEKFLWAMAKWLSEGKEIENIIFKTIETPYVPDYQKLFPEMKFLHIIRNPIDNWSSAKRSLMRNKQKLYCHLGWDNLETMIEKRLLPHFEVILENRNSPRHFLVKYEELIGNPLRVISGVCNFLGVEFPTEPIKQTVLGGRFVEKLYAEPSQKGVSTPIEVKKDLSKVYRYDEVITSRERNFIVWRLFNPAKQLGYFENFTRPGKINVFFQWLLPDKWEFMHAGTFKKIVKSAIAFFYRRAYIYTSLIKN